MLKIEDHISLLQGAMKLHPGEAVTVTRESLEAVMEVLSLGATEYAVQTFRKDSGEPLGVRVDAWTPWTYQVVADFEQEQFINRRHQTYGVRIVKRLKFSGAIEVVPEGEL